MFESVAEHHLVVVKAPVRRLLAFALDYLVIAFYLGILAATSSRSTEPPGRGDDYGRRRRTERELLALQRRFRKVRDRDYFGASGRTEAAAAIDHCLRYSQGISLKLTAVTDPHVEVD